MGRWIEYIRWESVLSQLKQIPLFIDKILNSILTLPSPSLSLSCNKKNWIYKYFYCFDGAKYLYFFDYEIKSATKWNETQRRKVFG